MYLTLPRHEILGMETPYTSTLFYDLCKSRDKSEQSICARFSTQLSLGALAIATLVETIVRAPIAIFGNFCIKDHSRWSKGYILSILTTIYCLYGLFINLFVKNITSYLISFDQFIRSDVAEVFFYDACKTGHFESAKALFDKGLDPHKKHRGITPTIAAHFSGNEKLKALLPLNQYEQDYMELKLLGHWLNLQLEVQLHGEKIELIGLPICNWMFSSMASTFAKFRESNEFTSHTMLTEEQAQTLEDALKSAESETSPEMIAQIIQNGDLRFISSGWKDHAICLCFYGNFMAVSNRGQGSEKAPTLSVFKTDPKLMKAEIIEEILMHRKLDAEKGMEYFYKTLPTKLLKSGKLSKGILTEDFEALSPKHAQSGNCDFSSKKGALRFAWAMLLSEPPTGQMLSYSQRLERARLETKLFTNWGGQQTFLDHPIDQYKKLIDSEEVEATAQASAQKKKARFDRLKEELHLAAFNGG